MNQVNGCWDQQGTQFGWSIMGDGYPEDARGMVLDELAIPHNSVRLDNDIVVGPVDDFDGICVVRVGVRHH